MGLFNRAGDFLGRMAGPSRGNEMTRVNNNKIAKFRLKLTNNAQAAFEQIGNKKMKLALINVFKGSGKNVNASDIQSFLTHGLQGQTNYGHLVRQAAATGRVVVRHGAAGAAGAVALPLAMLGDAGLKGGQAAAQGARVLGNATVRGAKAFAGKVDNTYGTVRNTFSTKYSKLSGRNTNKRVTNLTTRVTKLEERLQTMTNAAQKANQMMAKA
jgi:hypothetical protein